MPITEFQKIFCTMLLTLRYASDNIKTTKLRSAKAGGDIMINTNKIKGRMAELNLTQKDLAKAMGLSPSTISQKITGARPVTLDEAEVFASVLKIENEQFSEFFFAKQIA
jgi:plasmid maintenance system antidote protein VapI